MKAIRKKGGATGPLLKERLLARATYELCVSGISCCFFAVAVCIIAIYEIFECLCATHCTTKSVKKNKTKNAWQQGIAKRMLACLKAPAD